MNIDKLIWNIKYWICKKAWNVYIKLYTYNGLAVDSIPNTCGGDKIYDILVYLGVQDKKYLSLAKTNSLEKKTFKILVMQHSTRFLLEYVFLTYCSNFESLVLNYYKFVKNKYENSTMLSTDRQD